MDLPPSITTVAQAIRDAALAPASPETRARNAKVARINLAIIRAPQVFPGAIGKLIASELTGYVNMSWRWARGSLCEQLVDDVLSRPVPPPTPPSR